MTETSIDGRYLLYPLGSGWEYRRIKNGEVASETNQSQLGTHIAAHDAWAWLADVDEDALEPIQDEATHDAVLAACGYGDYPPENFVICPIEKP